MLLSSHPSPPHYSGTLNLILLTKIESKPCDWTLERLCRSIEYQTIHLQNGGQSGLPSHPSPDLAIIADKGLLGLAIPDEIGQDLRKNSANPYVVIIQVKLQSQRL